MEWSNIALRLRMKNKNSQLGCALFQMEHEIDRMKSSTFAGRFPLILKAFLVGGSWKSQSQPADLQWIVFDETTSHILCRPLLWSHCSQWKLLERCCYLWWLRSTPNKAFGCKKLVEYQPDAVGPPKATRWYCPNWCLLLYHWSIRSKNEIDWNILHRPSPEQKGLLCWLY